jgi:hypothetical protein
MSGIHGLDPEKLRLAGVPTCPLAHSPSCMYASWIHLLCMLQVFRGDVLHGGGCAHLLFQFCAIAGHLSWPCREQKHAIENDGPPVDVFVPFPTEAIEESLLPIVEPPVQAGAKRSRDWKKKAATDVEYCQQCCRTCRSTKLVDTRALAKYSCAENPDVAKLCEYAENACLFGVEFTSEDLQGLPEFSMRAKEEPCFGI